MITAIDTSVLIAVHKMEPGHQRWESALRTASQEGDLVIGPVVYAEFGVLFSSQSRLDEAVALLNLRVFPLSREAAFHASRTFLRYRRAGGPRTHLIPDFLIASQALVQANQLAAMDRGYLRTYFPKLKLLRPQ